MTVKYLMVVYIKFLGKMQHSHLIIHLSDHYLDVPQRLPSTSEGTTREQLSKGENSPPYTYGNSNQSVLIDSLMKKIVMVESEYGKLLEQNQILKEKCSIEEGYVF